MTDFICFCLRILLLMCLQVNILLTFFIISIKNRNVLNYLDFLWPPCGITRHVSFRFINSVIGGEKSSQNTIFESSLSLWAAQAGQCYYQLGESAGDHGQIHLQFTYYYYYFRSTINLKWPHCIINIHIFMFMNINYYQDVNVNAISIHLHI